MLGKNTEQNESTHELEGQHAWSIEAWARDCAAVGEAKVEDWTRPIFISCTTEVAFLPGEIFRHSLAKKFERETERVKYGQEIEIAHHREEMEERQINFTLTRGG